jgi:nucleoside-diphosphate-sugar epimerase
MNIYVIVADRKCSHNPTIVQTQRTFIMTTTVLVLGARGRFGLAAARAFAAAGWRVIGQMRPGAVQPTAPGIEWRAVELQDAAALLAAAAGARVVVHALNPSAYTNAAWQAESGPMLTAAIALCRQLDATLMLPGNVYNFGKDIPALLREDTPQQAHTVKGRIRMAMEVQLSASGARAVVIRAGDFFGAGRGSWFDLALTKQLAKGRFTYPGVGDVSTAWAYLPDLARTFVAVAERRDALAPFEVFHFAGHALTAQRWLEALTPVARAQGWLAPGASLKRAGMPWTILRLASPFVPAWAALLEMRYLWQTPHALANARLTALIGPEPHTPLPLAVAAALADLGLLAPATAPN